MKLADYQRTLMRLSFACEAAESDFEGFGDRARFVMYRQMVRSRLLGMAKQAFRNTVEVVGSAAFEYAFERYLAEHPPRSPYIRDVIADFGPFAGKDAELLARAPGFTSDLVHFEEAKWRVAYRKTLVSGVREFDFAGIPVFNPALEQIALTHRVHEIADQGCRAETCSLLVYRPCFSAHAPEGAFRQTDDIRWYTPDVLFSAIVAAARREPSQSLADLVRKVAECLGKPLDEALLEELASGVTLALQRGVLLGSSRSAPSGA